VTRPIDLATDPLWDFGVVKGRGRIAILVITAIITRVRRLRRRLVPGVSQV